MKDEDRNGKPKLEPGAEVQPNSNLTEKALAYAAETAEVCKLDVEPKILHPENFPDGLLARVKFFRLKTRVEMIASRKIHALLVLGETGIGKTTLTLKHLIDKGLRQGVDFFVSRGHTTPMALYRALENHNGAILIFDDCDAVLHNPISLNILKGALDDKYRRTISYLTERKKSELPLQFDFNGQVIFLTNKRFNFDDVHGDAIKSRCHRPELFLTRGEKLDFLKKIIVPQDYKTSSLADRQHVYRLLHDTVQATAANFNFRTFSQLMDLYIHDPANIDIFLSELAPAKPEIVLVMELLRTNSTVSEAMEKFMTLTNSSRRTFFSHKAKIDDCGVTPYLASQQVSGKGALDLQ